ncbi:PREDICTED: phospholipid-transporting ATPase IK [Propithecus coquereli]|uniref:phospholipid-transporting ATPase IK n=1 Tax=Propithecus coquereli TaxID=379532 RepID=UPI00063FB735|nr:PREDICTED: phospholipid-transporting ATPase IK [Propithecus coquereli]
MGDTGGRRGAQRGRKAQPGRAGKYELRPKGPAGMGSLSHGEDFQDGNENTAFTWDVKANNQAYNWQFKEKVFLCWHRQKYKTNVIRTAKYNFFSFLPWNLYEQFHHVSNVYFLLIIILQGIPEISTLPWFTLFAPLVCLIVIRATRDLVDDIGRHRSDRAINSRPCQVLVGKSFVWQEWKNLCVGDVIRLSKDSIVPADLLLLASTEPSSLCYVETADIDGETNLKFRQALMVTHQELTSTRKMASFQGRVTCEEPNSRMHQFVGCLEWNGKMYPLDIGNLLLRGCKIRNTDTCYGMVIYAGCPSVTCGLPIPSWCRAGSPAPARVPAAPSPAHPPPHAAPQIFLLLVVMSTALAMSFGLWMREFKDRHHYLWILYQGGVALESFFIFWAFLILLSAMVPLAMFIMAEFIYLGNSIFINWDQEMYYAPLDVPAKARSTSLNDQLGQVEYIFSDKTGTLTQNILTFKKCCIDGHVYGPDSESRTPKGNPYLWNQFADGKLRFHNEKLLRIVRAKRDKVVREFWRALAICHTVMVQEKDSERPDLPVYQAASPDEEALVTAARNFGYVFLSRTQDTITLMELGEERVYQVLAMMDFNSTRKRMSVLVRNPEGTICLYTKGADTVILERLHRKHSAKLSTEEALAAFAKETLRTLCLAYKEVDEATYKRWHQRHQEASVLLQNRAQALQEVYNKMEQNLKLLGATAIEDRLQDGVPDTIKYLKKASIKIWVLTGDKQETAVNIGFACQLLSDNIHILEEKEIVHILEACSKCSSNPLTKKGFPKFPPHIKLAMVIDGDFLDKLLLSLRKEPRALIQNVEADDSRQEPWEAVRDFLRARGLSMLWQNFGVQQTPTKSKDSKTRESPEVQRERAFVDLASRCQAVICCRVTPKQKALIVALVKKYHQVVTLAIGDGANDVNMIKTADIGVGLAGQEGMQAVQNSDFALGQFCFLQRLLLVHGRWSYMRVCKFLRYFIYKTLAITMTQIWFAFYNGFSAQPLYEGWFLALFNLLYTTLPCLYVGLFEQDVSAQQSLQMPKLYVAGLKGELFNYWVFLQAIAHGTATSLVNFFMTLWISWDTAGPCSFSDYQSFVVVVALSGLLCITMEVILIVKYWTVLFVVAIVLSLSFYGVMTYVTQSYGLYQISPKTFSFLYADHNMLSCPSTMLVILSNVTLNTLPVLALRMICQTLKKPYPKEEAEEEAPTEEIFTVEPIPHLHRGSCGRRSSYAFSHYEGYADLITQGTILQRPQEVSSELESDSPVTSEEELLLRPNSSCWHFRKLSLGRLRHHQGEVSFEEMKPSSAMSSSSSVDRQSAVNSDNQGSPTKKLPAAMNRASGSFQKLQMVKKRPLSPKQRPPLPENLLSTKEGSVPLPKERALPKKHQLSLPESQPQPSATKPLPLGQTLWGSQTESSEEKLSPVSTSVPLGESQPYISPKEPHASKEGTVVETLPGTEESSL